MFAGFHVAGSPKRRALIARCGPTGFDTIVIGNFEARIDSGNLSSLAWGAETGQARGLLAGRTPIV